MTVLVVTAVDAEANAIGDVDGATVVVAGIGRVNAAVAVTRACSGASPPRAVISAGVAGILPGSSLELGDVLVGSHAVYVEEGLITPEGFQDIGAMGFSLGAFEGNTIEADSGLLARFQECWPTRPIATVATCSGTDEAAEMVQARSGASAEAMEGAAVLHAASLAGVPAIEMRAMSNTTGDRQGQHWDLPAALDALGSALREAMTALD